MPDPNNLTDTIVVRLVDALNDMRDAMVKASLLLQDLSFESDAVQRSAAVEHLDELFKKVTPR
jgi:hypothetical protein